MPPRRGTARARSGSDSARGIGFARGRAGLIGERRPQFSRVYFGSWFLANCSAVTLESMPPGGTSPPAIQTRALSTAFRKASSA